MSVDQRDLESAKALVRHYSLTGLKLTWQAEYALAVSRALLAAAQDRAEVVEADRIMAKSNDEIMADALAEFGSAEAVSAEAERIRSMMLKTVADHMAPTPDPVVMRDYIDRLTRFFIDRPEWVALAEEARGYIGALSPRGERDG